MTRVASPSWLFAALLLTAVGCGSSDSKSTATSAAKACDDQVGEDCDCEDGSPSQYVCTDKELTCDCEDPPPPTTTKADAGKKPTSGTTGTGTTTTTKPDAKVPSSTGTTTTKSDAGTSTTTTTGGDKDGGGGTTMLAPTGGPDPVLPDIKGDCPEFTTGTATIGGLAGISVQAGAKGTGSGALVFYWHGTGSSSFEAGQFAGASEVVSGGGIVIAPSGSSGGGGMDCSGTGTFSPGDFDIADLIVACAVKNHGIDPHRIYTTGCSAGGLQAGCMGALRSSYVAAVLPNSGGEVFPLPFQDKTHIPALMTMHGGSSDMVIVTFSETSKSADMAYSAAGGLVVNCDHGMGHCGAPGDLQAAGWQFMKDHPFGIKTDPYASGLPASFPKYCMPFK